MSAGTIQRWASAPASRSPGSRGPQTCRCPARQAGQVPSARNGITVTASPTDHPVTPSPTAVTRPAVSCPITAGVVTRASMWPAAICRSVPQMPVKAGAISTSPSPGGRWGIRGDLEAVIAHVSRRGVSRCSHVVFSSSRSQSLDTIHMTYDV